MSERQNIFNEIDKERTAQDQQWGGEVHDDRHKPEDWCLYIDKQRRLARDADDPIEYEARMIKIAALAVAAMESLLRRR